LDDHFDVFVLICCIFHLSIFIYKWTSLNILL